MYIKHIKNDLKLFVYSIKLGNEFVVIVTSSVLINFDFDNYEFHYAKKIIMSSTLLYIIFYSTYSMMMTLLHTND